MLNQQLEKFIDQVSENTNFTEEEATAYTLDKLGYGEEYISDYVNENSVGEILEQAVEKHITPNVLSMHYLFFDQITGEYAVPLLWERREGVEETDVIKSTPLNTEFKNGISPLENGVGVLILQEDIPAEYMEHAGSSNYIFYRDRQELIEPMRKYAMNGSLQAYDVAFIQSVGTVTEGSASDFFKNVFAELDVNLQSSAIEALINKDWMELLIENANDISDICMGESLISERPITFDQFDNPGLFRLVGHTGSGKSVFLRMFESQLPDVRVVTIRPTGEGRDIYSEFTDKFWEDVRKMVDKEKESFVIVDDIEKVQEENEVGLRALCSTLEGQDSVTLVASMQSIDELQEYRAEYDLGPMSSMYYSETDVEDDELADRLEQIDHTDRWISVYSPEKGINIELDQSADVLLDHL